MTSDSTATGHVYVTRLLTDDAMALVDDLGHAVVVGREDPPTSEGVLRDAAGAAAVISTLPDRVDAAVLDAAGPQLRVVANVAVGFDNVDVDAARERGVVVTNTPGVLDAATADLTMGLVLAAARRIAEGDRFLRRGTPWVWGPSTLTEEERDAVDFLELPDLLAASDVVTLHCPLTPETRHLVDDTALARMRPTALLVNTARGGVVDTDALVRALTEGGSAAPPSTSSRANRRSTHGCWRWSRWCSRRTSAARATAPAVRCAGSPSATSPRSCPAPSRSPPCERPAGHSSVTPSRRAHAATASATAVATRRSSGLGTM